MASAPLLPLLAPDVADRVNTRLRSSFGFSTLKTLTSSICDKSKLARAAVPCAPETFVLDGTAADQVRSCGGGSTTVKFC